MATIAWWLSIPIVATVLAILWVAWASRPKPPKNTHDSLQSHQRFRAAMENDTFGARRPADPATGTTTADGSTKPRGAAE